MTPERRKQIEDELAYIENALSPENLHWDGERPLAAARAAEKELIKRQRKLLAELSNDS